MSNRQSFTPQVQDTDGQSISKHFDEESWDYLASNSHENQSEDDHESTDDSLDPFTDHQVHLSTSCQWLCLSCMTSRVFFLLLIEIISIANLLIIVHFFVWKHEKQTLSYIHTKFEGDRNTFFFLQFILWEHPFFCPNTENYLGLRGWCSWNYLVWIGLTLSKLQKLWSVTQQASHATVRQCLNLCQCKLSFCVASQSGRVWLLIAGSGTVILLQARPPPFSGL